MRGGWSEHHLVAPTIYAGQRLGAVQKTIRHEVAHILVHNTPGMEEAPAHGVEFDAVLAVVEAMK